MERRATLRNIKTIARVVESHPMTTTSEKILESNYYLTQRVRAAIDVLIGDASEQNLQRLQMAALKGMQGVLAVEAMSEHTRGNLDRLCSDEFHNFHTLKDALIGYVLSSQRDVGQSLNN
jgi:hypothetical protein